VLYNGTHNYSAGTSGRLEAIFHFFGDVIAFLKDGACSLWGLHRS